MADDYDDYLYNMLMDIRGLRDDEGSDRHTLNDYGMIMGVCNQQMTIAQWSGVVNVIGDNRGI